MVNGVPRYYQYHDNSRKDSRGFSGVYSIIDRITSEEVCAVDTYHLAQEKVAELERKDKIERGIKIIDVLEIPYAYKDKFRSPTEVSTVTIHK